MSHLASRKVESIYIGWASLHECELELGHANGTRKPQRLADPEHIQTDNRVSETPNARREEVAKYCEEFVVFKNGSNGFTYQQPK